MGTPVSTPRLRAGSKTSTHRRRHRAGSCIRFRVGEPHSRRQAGAAAPATRCRTRRRQDNALRSQQGEPAAPCDRTADSAGRTRRIAPRRSSPRTRSPAGLPPAARSARSKTHRAAAGRSCPPDRRGRAISARPSGRISRFSNGTDCRCAQWISRSAPNVGSIGPRYPMRSQKAVMSMVMSSS